MSIKFSVILPIYWKNEFNEFKKTFLSIINQTLKPNEIVIIFDGKVNSNIESFIKKQKKKYNIKLLKNQKNLGLGKTLKKAVNYCKNEIIARVDCDDINLPDRFKRQISIMIKNNLDLVGSSTLEIDLNNRINMIKSNPLKDFEIKKKLKFRNPINHQSVIFKKKAVLISGNYENLPFFEDYYLWVKMARNNHKFGNLKKILVKVRLDEDFYKRRSGKSYFVNYFKFLRRCLKIKFITSVDFIILIILRGLIYLLNVTLIKNIYIFFLRKKI